MAKDAPDTDAEDGRMHALLTDHQRQLLRGEHPDATYAARYNAKKRIRERLRAGLLDLRLLSLRLEEEDLQRVFDYQNYMIDATDEDEENALDDLADSAGDVPDIVAPALLPSALGFFIRASNHEDHDVFPELKGHGPGLVDFTEAVADAYEDYLAAEKKRVADVTVTVEFENVRPIDELREAVAERDDSPGLEEAATLAAAGVDVEALVAGDSEDDDGGGPTDAD